MSLFASAVWPLASPAPLDPAAVSPSFLLLRLLLLLLLLLLEPRFFFLFFFFLLDPELPERPEPLFDFFLFSPLAEAEEDRPRREESEELPDDWLDFFFSSSRFKPAIAREPAWGDQERRCSVPLLMLPPAIIGGAPGIGIIGGRPMPPMPPQPPKPAGPPQPPGGPP